MKITNQKGFENIKPLLVGLVLLLVVSNLATVYLLKKSSVKPTAVVTSRPDDSQPVSTTTPETMDTDGDGLSDADEINKYKTDPSKADTDGDGFNDKNELDSGHDPLVSEKEQASQALPLKDGEISVAWQEWPAKKGAYQLYHYADLENYLIKGNGKEAASEKYGLYSNALSSYEVGTITAGVYAGKKLFILAYQEPEGPSFGPDIFRVVQSTDEKKKSIILGKQSREPYGLVKSLFDLDSKTVIAGLEPQDKLNIPDSSIKLTKREVEPYKFINDYPDAKKMFKIDGDQYLYKSESLGCFIAKAKDGTAREYDFTFPFATGGKKKPDSSSREALQVSLTFGSEATTTIAYNFEKLATCGPLGCYNYPAYIKSKEQLERIGFFGNGDPVWGLKDKHETYQLEDKKKVEILKEIYDSYYPGWDDKAQKDTAKVSYEKFLASHPVIYWQDPFGAFLELRNANYIPAVECGKPVIYLYPTKTTTVAVKVAPTGGFSVTEPEYGDGWRVEAKPTGELKNLSDGKTYPYLFWEGKGLDYSQPKEGFVVARSETAKFLKSKLALLGLNAKESSEFMAFWLPRMQSKPYYFITFVPKSQFDQLAPLSVEPRPETVIRVFMDYRGLDERITVPEQKIVTPKRLGFTVVEWGGALHN